MQKEKRARLIKKKGEASGPSVEAIVFDAYGTLFDLDSFGRDAEQIHHGYGKEIAGIVRQKQIEFAMTRTILGKYVNFEILTRNAIEFALKETGIKRTDASVEKLFSAFQNLQPYKDVAKALNVSRRPRRAQSGCAEQRYRNYARQTHGARRPNFPVRGNH